MDASSFFWASAQVLPAPGSHVPKARLEWIPDLPGLGGKKRKSRGKPVYFLQLPTLSRNLDARAQNCQVAKSGFASRISDSRVCSLNF